MTNSIVPVLTRNDISIEFTKDELTPTWEEKFLRPAQARSIAFSSELQLTLPV
jgi:hypothetical protein